MRLLAAAEVDEERIEDLHLDIAQPRPLDVLPNHRQPIFGVEERALLLAGRRDRNDQLVVELRRPLDEVEVTERHRVERPGIDGLGHGRSLLVVPLR